MSNYIRLSDDKFYYCPYCKHKHKGSDLSEDSLPESIDEHECGECGKTFDYWYECKILYKTKSKDMMSDTFFNTCN